MVSLNTLSLTRGLLSLASETEKVARASSRRAGEFPYEPNDSQASDRSDLGASLFGLGANL